MKIPPNLDKDYILSLRDSVRNIDYATIELISNVIHFDLDKVDLTEHTGSLTEEDLFKLSDDDANGLKLKILVQEHLNKAINAVLLQKVICPLGQRYKSSPCDVAYFEINNEIYAVSGGEQRYSYNSPTESYDYIVSLNVLGV
tara:strand:- start:534 stop:962 length:429 start_codon:yes stop_codon:yes gene_type:complete